MNKNQSELDLQIETENLKEKMEELKKEKLDCFKLCFRVKVADAIYYEQLKQKEREWMEMNPDKVFKDSEEYKKEMASIIE